MKHLAVLVGVLALSMSAASADDHKYSLKDLKALIDQKGYQEVLQHLDDISPADRNQDWINVAGTASAGYLATAEDGQKLQIMMMVEKQYPTVVKSPAYTRARLDAIPHAFSKCYDQAGSSYGGQDERMKGYDKCLEVGQKFIDSEPGNAGLPLAIAKATGHTSYPYKSIGMFRLAITAAGKSGASVCQEPAVAGGIVNGLHFLGGKQLAEAKELAATCWTTVKKPLFVELNKTTNKSYKTAACEIASAQKDFGPDDKQACAGAPKP
jgi:hypothetical protein